MTDIKHVFIINPAAGKSDRTAETAGHISEAARRLRLDYTILQTEYPRHATQLVKRAAERFPNRHLRFYACGGDGTLNEVAAAAVDIENSEFTHFPIGSGNDFIKIFGENSLPRFNNIGELTQGDVVLLDYIRSDCGVALNVLSCGVDARIANGMPKYKRIPMMHGERAYMMSMVENVIRGIGKKYEVCIDGRHFDGAMTLILAANGRYYGGGFNPVPDADLSDGLIDILLIKKVSRFTVASVIGAYKAGKYRDLPQYINHIKAKNVDITALSERTMPVNRDGEIVITDSVHFGVSEKKMRFIVPKGVTVEQNKLFTNLC